jgi:hypothetical protein
VDVWLGKRAGNGWEDEPRVLPDAALEHEVELLGLGYKVPAVHILCSPMSSLSSGPK